MCVFKCVLLRKYMDISGISTCLHISYILYIGIIHTCTSTCTHNALYNVYTFFQSQLNNVNFGFNIFEWNQHFSTFCSTVLSNHSTIVQEITIFSCFQQFSHSPLTITNTFNFLQNNITIIRTLEIYEKLIFFFFIVQSTTPFFNCNWTIYH